MEPPGTSAEDVVDGLFRTQAEVFLDEHRPAQHCGHADVLREQLPAPSRAR